MEHQDTKQTSMSPRLKELNDIPYYTYVLKESISDGQIIKEYENFAVRAYEGVACCNSCDNEYTWELSSDILEKYRDYFVSHQ